MTDNIDYQLTRAVNSGYGIKIANATPIVSGANIPKLRVTNAYTTDIWVAGSVQTLLRLTQPLTTTSGDLMLSSASGTINMDSSSLINYTAPSQPLLDLYYQGTPPVDPSANVLRIYVDDSGQLSLKQPSGVVAALDTSNLTSDRIFTLPNATTTLIGADVTQTLTNKTIDTAGPNTIQIAGTDITSLVGQDVRSTASPSFVSETLSGSLTLSTAAFHPIIVNQSGSTTTNDILFQKAGVDIFGVGTNETTSETYTWTTAARDYKIGTNNTERLRVLSTGISNDNSITNVLGLQGTTLVYKNNLPNTSTSQTFTNKTINTAGPNTIQIGGTDITSLVGQDVRSTASPTFQAIFSTTSTSLYGSKVVSYRGTTTTTDASTVTLITIPVATSNSTVIIYSALNAFGVSGSTANQTCAQRLFSKITNVAGTLSITNFSNVFVNNFSTAFGPAASGTNVQLNITGIASNTIRWTLLARVYSE